MIGAARTHVEVVKALPRVDTKRALEVLRDMIPTPNGTGVVGDSRNVPSYANVISDKVARKVLRKTGDLQAAVEALQPLSLAERIHRAIRAARGIRDEIESGGVVDEDAHSAIEELRRVVESLPKRSS